MAKYCKKPIEIEAFQWTGGHDQVEDPQWIINAIEKGEVWFIGSNDTVRYMQIDTLEGVMTASKGDYIIKGVQDEIYPCKPDIFEMTYEASE